MGKLISEQGASLKGMPPEKCAMQKTSVGSGAAVKPSMFKIETSAPSEMHTLGRAPKGWLK